MTHSVYAVLFTAAALGAINLLQAPAAQAESATPYRIQCEEPKPGSKRGRDCRFIPIDAMKPGPGLITGPTGEFHIPLGGFTTREAIDTLTGRKQQNK